MALFDVNSVPLYNLKRNNSLFSLNPNTPFRGFGLDGNKSLSFGGEYPLGSNEIYEKYIVNGKSQETGNVVNSTQTQPQSETGNREESEFDFFNRIKGYDKDYIDSAKKFINQKTIGDLLGTGLSLYSNLTAPLPDQIAAPHYSVPEINMPINLLRDINNEQQSNLASLGLNLSRVTGSDVTPALGGNLVQGNIAFNKGLGQTMNEFITGQQQQATQIGNANVEAVANANAANAKIVADDNLKRSELTSGLFSQLGSIMTQRGSSLLGLQNMNTNQAIMEKYVEGLIKSGNMAKLAEFFKNIKEKGFVGSDVGIDDEKSAAENFK